MGLKASFEAYLKRPNQSTVHSEGIGPQLPVVLNNPKPTSCRSQLLVSNCEYPVTITILKLLSIRIIFFSFIFFAEEAMIPAIILQRLTFNAKDNLFKYK